MATTEDHALAVLNAASLCRTITTSEFVVLAAITLTTYQGIDEPTIAAIAKGAKMSDRGTRNAIAALEAGGWLAVTRRFSHGPRGTLPHRYAPLVPSATDCAPRVRATESIEPHDERAWLASRSAGERMTWTRDGGACRYCGSCFDPTFDHIVPRCQGGLTTTENLVVACRGCNSKKGGRTPAQAGMALLSRPEIA